MPRRDAISEKKRERLALEHAQLQQLMFHARSSMRRSSLTAKDAGSEEPLADSFSNSPLDQLEATQQFYPVFHTEQDEEEVHPRSEIKDVNVSTAEPRDWEIVSKNGRSVIINHPDNAFETTAASAPAWDIEKVSPKGSTNLQYADTDEPDVYEPFVPEPYRRRQTSRTIVWTVILVLAVIVGGVFYYFKSGTNHEEPLTTSRIDVPIATPNEETSTVIEDSEITTGTETNPTLKNKTDESAVAAKPGAKTEKKAAPGKSSLGTFSVISKAYFHDAPDESTRRKAFIIHWNNAVLTPSDEQNGFFYIVFTNHLGQTSKGWLRKKDLRRLN